MDKCVYITGGSKGIGKGIAAYLLSKGCKVAISARKAEEVKAAVEELDPTGKNALGIVSDVRHFQQEQQAVATILQAWGRLDVLVANAGVGLFAPIDQMDPEAWYASIDTNLTGVFHSVKASMDALKSSKGYIITIASLAGTNFFAEGAAYNASKFGLVGFTQAMMLDLREYGIKVSTIMPGSVTSHFNGHVPAAGDAWKIQPEDMGELVYDLLHMNPRALPSKVEIRPSQPPVK